MVVVRAATQSTQPQPKVKTTNVLLLLDVADVDTSNNSSNISHISPRSTTAAFRDVRIPAAPEAAPLAAGPARSINPEIQIHCRLVMARVLLPMSSYSHESP